LKLWGVGVVG